MLPATRQVVSDFHRDVLDSQKPTWYLNERYQYLREHSSLRTLPTVTAKLFLRRLLQAKHYGHITRLLLEHDLDEAVVIICEALNAQTLHVREFGLFKIYRKLCDVKQNGLANQILVHIGISSASSQAAFRRLQSLQQQLPNLAFDDTAQIDRVVASCKADIALIRKDRSSELDSRSAFVIVRRAVQVGQMDYAAALCQQCWYAEEASKLFINTQTEDGAFTTLKGLTAQSEKSNSGMEITSTWIHVIRRLTKIDYLESLMKIAPRNPDIRRVLAVQAAGHPESITAFLLELGDVPIDRIPRFIFEMLDKAPRPLSASQVPVVQNNMNNIIHKLHDGLITEVLDRYFKQIRKATEGRLAKYPMTSLMAILNAINDIDYVIPDHIHDAISKTLLHRPHKELLQYVNMSKPDFPMLTRIFSHHLRARRIVDGYVHRLKDQRNGTFLNTDDLAILSKQLAAELGPIPDDILQHGSIDPAVFHQAIVSLYSRRNEHNLHHILALHEQILRSLVEQEDSSILLKYVQHVQAAGLSLTTALASTVVRVLARKSGRQHVIYDLLRSYPTDVMTYDIFARYISRLSPTDPSAAIAFLKLMVRKKLMPRRRLLQNMMLGISQSTAIAQSRILRYLTIILAHAELSRVSIDRIFLSSLLKAILVVQGLGAATARLNWVLRHSAKVMSRRSLTYASTKDRADRGRRAAASRMGSGSVGRIDSGSGIGHHQLMEVVTKWHKYERNRTMENRTTTASQQRPKQLRLVIGAAAYRRSVIGRKKRRQSALKAQALAT